jgi:VWFA-related protein
MKSCFAILLLAAVLASITAAPALAVPADPPSQSSFGESIDVRVVNVEAVVTDRKGNRIPGLTAADFRLLVDGREVTIDYFTEVQGGEVAAAAPAPKEGAPAAAAPVGPGEKVGTNYLVYIDNQFSIPAPRNIVLRRLAADLGRLGSQDRMAVIAFDGRKLKRLSDWTGDRQTLARAFAQAEESPSFGLLALAERRSDNNDNELLDDDELKVESASAAMGMGSGIELGMRAVIAAMRGTPAPPGRKVLVFLNGGWGFSEPPMQERGAPSAIDLPQAELIFAPVYDTANLIGYTLYPVEVHGMLFSDSLWNDARVEKAMPHDFITSSFGRSVHDDLEVMARETGGKAFLNSARLDAFARVAADTSSYYWLGFSPEWRADGSRHDIRVEVRRPGLAVRSRSGFSDLSRETEAQAQAESLLLYGGPRSDAPLVVTAGALRRVSFRMRELPVTVEIPADALASQPAEAGWTLTGSLSIALLEKDAASPHWKTLPVRLTTSKLPPAGGRAQWQTVVKLPRSASKLLFALGGEHGEIRAWTQLDLQHLTTALTKEGK